MVRQVTDDDEGLKPLYPPEVVNGGKGEDCTIDVVAVHGLGAHPDDTWTKNRGTKEQPEWINWLQEKDMLPAVLPHARIMRYGYKSGWFGKEDIRQSARTVADMLLRTLRRKRAHCPSRPLIFIAHSFGGLVVLQALREAYRYRETEWPYIVQSTVGFISFGTPFRGADGLSQSEMVAAAAREYEPQDIETRSLEILDPDNEVLQDLLDDFQKGVWPNMPNARIACFYELQASEIGAIVGKQRRRAFAVNERSGCLDLTDRITKYPLQRTHFNMNKFARPTEQAYEDVVEAVEEMAKEAERIGGGSDNQPSSTNNTASSNAQSSATRGNPSPNPGGHNFSGNFSAGRDMRVGETWNVSGGKVDFGR